MGLWDSTVNNTVFKRSEWTEGSVCILFNPRSTVQRLDYTVIFVFKHLWRPQKVKLMDLTNQTFRAPLYHTTPPVEWEPFVFKYKHISITYKPTDLSQLSLNSVIKHQYVYCCLTDTF